MKTRAFACLAGLLLATAAKAGTPTTEMAPMPESGLWRWFIGGSVGYLTDLEEAMYGLQAGMEYQTPGAQASHAIFLEVGYTQDDASYRDVPPAGNVGGASRYASLDLDIIPITLNYRYQATITGRLNGYAGLGAGIAIADSSLDWSWNRALLPPNDTGSGSNDESDVLFYGHLFAGLSYDVTDSFEIFTGVRYVFMDNHDLKADIAGQPLSHDAGIDGDVLIELGMRYRF